jgi:anaerobic selenocysteine-containing dehydrogenase
MMIGNNPLTSHYAWQGSVPPFSPSRRLRDAKARGLSLICVDPRRTMVAQLADIHLQVRPGEDATLLAGMLKLILDEGLHDREFCDRHVAGPPSSTARSPTSRLNTPRAADVPLAYSRRRALFAAAWGRPRPTGAEMATRGSPTEHPVRRSTSSAGASAARERLPCPRVLSAATPRAQVQPPAPLWGDGFASRIRDSRRSDRDADSRASRRSSLPARDRCGR